MIIYPTINDYYAEHPNVLEALKLMQPAGDGPEYDQQRLAYDRFLHTIAACYALWSANKSLILTVKRIDHDE
jgi:hypothetical protein